MLARRPMQAADLQQVLAIENTANRFPWSLKNFSDCLQGSYQCWLYEVEQQLVGFVIVQTILDEVHLLNICVRPELQGRGLGRQMLVQVVEDARNANASLIVLEVRRSNHRAQQLYLQTGFNEMSVRRAYYPAEQGREDALLMGMDIGSLDLFADSTSA